MEADFEFEKLLLSKDSEHELEYRRSQHINFFGKKLSNRVVMSVIENEQMREKSCQFLQCNREHVRTLTQHENSTKC